MDWCLIASGWTDPMNWLYGLYVAIGLGFVIFVHELGHFLVAKMCGVKCEKFMIGFDIGGIRLLSYRRGDTLYGLGILPLGGYVKMLGQEDNPAALRREMERARMEAGGGDRSTGLDRNAEAPPTEGGPAIAPTAGAEGPEPSPEAKLYDPRSYLAKSVPQRMAIISAGVIMNMIFAFILAVIAYGFGVKENPSTVGSVVSGSPAWQAGVRADDMVLAVAGRKVHTYMQLMQEIVNGDAEHGFPLLIQRPGVKEPFEIVVKPQKLGGKPTIGVGPAIALQITKEEEAPVCLPGSAASEAAPPFLHGDRILKIDGQPILTYGQLRDYLAAHADGSLQVTVARTKTPDDDKAETAAREDVAMVVPSSPMKQFGVAMQMGPIAAVQAGSPAATANFQPGDVIKSITTTDGKPVAMDPMRLPEEIRKLAGHKITVDLERDGKARGVEVELSLPSRFNQPDLQDSPMALNELGAAFYVLNQVASVEPGGIAAEAGLQPGDRLLKVRILPPSDEQLKVLRKRFRDDRLDQPEMEVAFEDNARNWPFFMLSPAVGLQYTLPGTTVEFTCQRDGKEMKSVKVAPVAAKDWFYPDRGWDFEPVVGVQRAHSVGEAIEMGAAKTVDSALLVYRMLHSVGTGKVSPRMISGPVGIVGLALAVARSGLGDFLAFLTLLSANLAVLNFLPIPVLDGGHMALLIYEGIRGKPADERVQEAMTWFGLILLLTLMIWAFGLDLKLFARPGAH